MNFRETVPEEIREIFKKSFLSKSQQELKKIYQSINPILDEVEEINSLIDSARPDPIKLKEIPAREEVIYQLIKDMWVKPAGSGFSDKYPDFMDSIQIYIEKLPEFQKEEQSLSRFKALEIDRWHIRFKKYLKYNTYKISIIPLRIYNWFLIKFKKTAKPIRFWNHLIPVRRAVSKVYQIDLIKALMIAEKSRYSSMINTLLRLIEYEANSDMVITFKDDKLSLERLSDPDSNNQIEKIKNEIAANIGKYAKDVREILAEKDNEFLEIMDKTNTLEFSKNHLSHIKLKRRFKKYNDAWLENSEGWSRTIYALFDDWRLDLELNRLKYVAYNELFLVKKRLKKEKQEYLKSIVKISEILKDFEASIKKETGISRNKLQYVKSTIQKKIDEQILPEIINQFDSKTLIGILRQIEIKLENEFDAISESRALVKTDQYSQALKEQDINFIKPNELILFEVFPAFLNLASQLKNSIFNQLETIIKLIPDIDNIVLFSIDTTINATDPDQEQINSENIQIILNGIGRAQNRTSEVQGLIEKLFNTYDQQLIEALQKFTNDAVALMQNENALAIRIKLLKAKALQQTKSYKEKFGGQIFRIFNLSRNIFKSRITDLTELYISLRKKYFLQPSDAIITQEISEFLSESEKSINQLPIIYRRLYKVEPVTDMDLFIGRNLEYEAVQSSYQNWINGRASSTVIIGEKWGGLSSLINYLMVNIKFKYPVVRICPEQKYYRKGMFHRFLATSLSIDPLTDQEGLIHAINNSTLNRIIILEDIQHLYLRSINGFDAIRSLIEIVNQTQKKILWIFTCTQYAWNYLVKSIQIDNFYNRVVKMVSMNNEEINSVIRKRNQIGGFRIIFEVPEEMKDFKKFKSSSEEEQQKTLEKRFFRKLNAFADSNISMALIFWLLSTKKVTDDLIMVGDFDNPDQSFIQVMTQSRIFILLSLILHDGLTVNELSLVNNQAQDDVGLHISSLQDDGIIIRQTDLFMVNPLIYRNVISVLKSKNLIH